MINLVILNGRISKDLELKVHNEIYVLRFNVAVNRTKKKDDESYDADFINCVAFGKSAETINEYFTKGDGIIINGRIQTGKYDKDGQTIYTTDVIVNSISFPVGKKARDEVSQETHVDIVDSSELPF